MTPAIRSTNLMPFPLYFAGFRGSDPSESGYIVKPKSYEYFPPSSQPNAGLQDIVQIEPDGGFLLLDWYLTGVASQDSGPSGTFNLTITDSNFYQLFSNYPSSNISQSPVHPSPFPAPHLFRASGRILLNFQSAPGSGFGIVFDGLKVFRVNP